MEVVENERWKFRLSTGKMIDACMNTIGLSPDSVDNLTIYEGHDGTLGHSKLTSDEMIEVADYMISLWQKLRESVKEKQSIVFKMKCGHEIPYVEVPLYDRGDTSLWCEECDAEIEVVV